MNLSSNNFDLRFQLKVKIDPWSLTISYSDTYQSCNYCFPDPRGRVGSIIQRDSGLHTQIRCSSEFNVEQDTVFSSAIEP
ncbi:hypothetical protein L1987_19672 [Smallanthus sonchifolius]|uniref:Uncharacterized protein n=1 Tax=Smallanthus sonchifolius TaxID=185202 RepID=A0ACB9IRS2_9ASTR|nr:hypothetical protein L1987_19672 [Smallanthus sonchifolius]